MIDPVTATLAINAIGAAGYMVGSLVNQVGRIFFSDKSTRLSLELRREELSAIETRFLLDLKERRELKLIEIYEHFKNSILITNHERRLQRWPFVAQAMDIVQSSAAHSSIPLNIMFTTTPSRNPEECNSVLNLIAKPIRSIERRIDAAFCGDVIMYNEIGRDSPHSGNVLKRTLWNLLQTESTVLIEADVIDCNTITFDICHWGCAFASSGSVTCPIVPHSPITIDLPPMRPGATDERQMVLEVGLTSIVTLLGDVYRALQRPHELFAPVFPFHMGTIAPEDAWKPTFDVYLNTYEMVARHSPQIASELAAKAAIAAFEAGHKIFAYSLLDKAIAFYRQATRLPLQSDESLVMALIRTRRNNNAPSALARALDTIRGLSKGSEEDHALSIDLNELARIMTSHLN